MCAGQATAANFDPAIAASLSIAAGAPAGWSQFSLTSLVQQWAAGTAPNDGLLLKLDDETRVAGKSVDFYSSEWEVAPTLRPKLAVSYAENVHPVAPTVAISKPTAGALVRGSVQIDAGAFDDRRLESVQFFVDGNSIGTDTTEPFSFAWSSTNGAHSLTARATDDAGNQTTSTAVAVTADNTPPPTTSITSPTGGSVTGTVTVSASASAGVTKVEFYADNALYATDTSSPYSASWNTLDPALPAYDDSHTLTTRAYDGLGQVTTSAPVSVTAANRSGQYFADFSSATLPLRVEANPAQTSPVDVAITNRSTTTWNGSSVFLRYRWFAAGSSVSVYDSGNTTIGPVLPNGTVNAHVDVVPPTLPPGAARADYVLRFDLYDTASSSWFAATGNKPLAAPVVVGRQADEEKLGLERYFQYETEELGLGMRNYVNVATGNSVIRWTPLSAPGEGLSSVLQLTYNSLDNYPGAEGNCPAEECPAGDGWSLAISSLTRLGHNQFRPQGNKLQLVDADGTLHEFSRENQNSPWVPPAGSHLYLRGVTDVPGEPTAAWALTRPDRVTFYYDDKGFPLSVVDKNANKLRFLYEDYPSEPPGNKRLKEVVDQGGRSFQLAYYESGTSNKRLKQITDHSGHKLEFSYGEHGKHVFLEEIKELGGTNADGSPLQDRTFQFGYDDRELQSVEDPNGNSTDFLYYQPQSGNDDKLETRTDRAGKLTDFAYPPGQTTTVTAPLDRITSYHYLTGTNDGSVDEITNAANETTQLVWTISTPPLPCPSPQPLRHLWKVIEPSGEFIERCYNQNGLVTHAYDQLRHHTEYRYTDSQVDGDSGDSNLSISDLTRLIPPKGGQGWTLDYYLVPGTSRFNGNLKTISDPLPTPDTGITTFYYYESDRWKLSEVVDPRGNSTFYSDYELNGFPGRVTDDIGRIAQYFYDESGLLLSVQDPLHYGEPALNDFRTIRTFYDYDSFHRLGRTSRPKTSRFNHGKLIWTSAKYDPNDNLLSSRQPGYDKPGEETTASYDFMDRPETVANPQGETTAFSYDDAGRLKRITAPRGSGTPSADDFVTENSYDLLDRVVTQTRYPDDGSAPRRTHYCYEENTGDLLWVTAPRALQPSPPDCNVQNPNPPSYTTRYAYDDAHRLLSVTEPLDTPGGKTRIRSVAYDDNGNVELSTDEDGTKTTFTYTPRDELEKKIETFTKDASNNPTRTLTTKYVYDKLGNLVREVSPRAWDACGLCDPGDEGDYVTSYRYDQVNQLERIALPKSGTFHPFHHTYIHRRYDLNGNLNLTTLPIAADELGTLCQTDPKQCTELEHFDPGWIYSSDDHVNAKAFFNYRAEGRQSLRHACTASTQPVCTDRSWDYFADGMLAERRVERTGPENGNGQATYTYDPDNNLVTATESIGDTRADVSAYKIEAVHNGYDELTQTRQKQESDSDWRYTNYRYDENGNATKRWDNGTAPEVGREHDFTYDEADQLTRDWDWGPNHLYDDADDQRAAYTYMITGWDAEKKIDRKGSGWPQPEQPSRVTTNWTYFANGDLKHLTTKHKNTIEIVEIAEDHEFSYLQCPTGGEACGESQKLYLNGNRAKDVFSLKGPSSEQTDCEGPATCTTSYEYGPRENIVFEQALWRNPGGGGETNTWTYDDAMNVRDDSVHGNGHHYEYDGNRLKWIEQNTQIQSKYFYDVDGNLESSPRTWCNSSAWSAAQAAVSSSTSCSSSLLVLSSRTGASESRLR